MKRRIHGALCVTLLFAFSHFGVGICSSTLSAQEVHEQCELTPAQKTAFDEIRRFFNVQDFNRKTSVVKLIKALQVFDSSFDNTVVERSAVEIRDMIRAVQQELPQDVRAFLEGMSDADMETILNEIKALDLLVRIIHPATDPATIEKWPELVDRVVPLIESSPRYGQLSRKLLELRDCGSWSVCLGLKDLLGEVPSWVTNLGKETGAWNLTYRIKT